MKNYKTIMNVMLGVLVGGYCVDSRAMDASRIVRSSMRGSTQGECWKAPARPLVPDIPDLAVKLYHLKAVPPKGGHNPALGISDIDCYMRAHPIILYKDPNSEMTDGWVLPKNYQELVENYPSFLMKLSTTLELITTSIYNGYNLPYTKETLTDLLDKVLFLVTHYDKEKIGDSIWEGYREQVYYQLAQIVWGYPDLRDAFHQATQFSSFLSSYAEITKRGDSELNKRIKIELAGVFPDDNDQERLDQDNCEGERSYLEEIGS